MGDKGEVHLGLDRVASKVVYASVVVAMLFSQVNALEAWLSCKTV
jgi:hypothetical protein